MEINASRFKQLKLERMEEIRKKWKVRKLKKTLLQEKNSRAVAIFKVK